MFLNTLRQRIVCLSFSLSFVSGLNATPGAQEVLGQLELDGIPMHRISVETRAHAAVDVKIDGRVTEAVWQSLPTFDNMIVAVPGTGEPGGYPTEIRLFATEKGFFVSAVMQQPVASLVQRLTRSLIGLLLPWATQSWMAKYYRSGAIPMIGMALGLGSLRSLTTAGVLKSICPGP